MTNEQGAGCGQNGTRARHSVLTSFRLAQLLNAGGLVLSEGGNARDRSTFARMARFSETVDGMRDEVKAVLAMPPGEEEGGYTDTHTPAL